MKNLSASLFGVLKGHNDWVTCIDAPKDPDRNFLVSGSRDKTAIIWTTESDGQQHFSYPFRSLEGHSSFIQDIALNSTNQFVMTGSWDRTIRIWDLASGTCFGKFVGHEGDVMSVAFSHDDRQIISGSRDKTLRIWNSRGNERLNRTEDSWVNCVRYANTNNSNNIITGSHSRQVTVWNEKFEPEKKFLGHEASVQTLAISPDGTLCATASKDGVVMLWDLNIDKFLKDIKTSSPVNSLSFNPRSFHLAIATDKSILIRDLKTHQNVEELIPETSLHPNVKVKDVACKSLSWNADGTILYSGYTDCAIRLWKLNFSI